VRSQLKKVSFKPSNDFEERKSARLIPWLCAQTAATRIGRERGAIGMVEDGVASLDL
jgi:hypothetical protein